MAAKGQGYKIYIKILEQSTWLKLCSGERYRTIMVLLLLLNTTLRYIRYYNELNRLPITVKIARSIHK